MPRTLMAYRCRKPRSIPLLLAALVLAVSLWTSPVEAQLEPGAPAGAGLHAERLEKIPAVLEGYVEKGEISGAVTLVAKDGKIVHLAAVGKADVENDRAMTTDSVFAIASMTKPISATAVMMLKDAGKLSLDDPVSKYIPEFREAALKDGAAEREVTIRDMLTHTSGLGGSQEVKGSLAETARELAQRPLSFQPGTKWQYSPGLNVCGRIVEVVSGQSYHEFLQTQIFDPLQMTDTSFFPSPELQQRLARLYQPGETPGTIQPAEHWLTDFSGTRQANPSGGLISSARDMARFYQMVLNGGEWNGKRLLSAEAVREMTTLQTGDLVTGFTPGNGWGYGWCVVRAPQGVSGMLSPGTYGHGGAFGTQGWVDPQRGMIFVLMIQRTGFGNSDGAEIREKFQQAAVDALQ